MLAYFYLIDFRFLGCFDKLSIFYQPQLRSLISFADHGSSIDFKLVNKKQEV